MLIWKGHTRIIKSNSGFCDLKPSTCCFVLCAPLKTMLYPRSVRKTHQARLQQAGSSADWDLWAKLLLGCPSSFPALAELCGKEDKTQDLWGLFSRTFCHCVPVKHQFGVVKGVYAVQPTESYLFQLCVPQNTNMVDTVLSTDFPKYILFCKALLC